MATTKAKTTAKSKKSSSSQKSARAAAKSVVAEKTERVEKTERRIIASTPKKGAFSGFFARKYDASENILTIFKTPRIIGALFGEIIGTMLLAIVLLTLGVGQPIYIMFAVLGITIAVYAFSGAHLNPAITVGQMVTRRISPIRGTLYIIAQVLGAWFGLLIASAFATALPESTMELQKMSVIEQELFWVVTMLEFFAAAVIGFFFARALIYKKSAFTFAAVVAGGVSLAFLISVVVATTFLGVQIGFGPNVFILNPAVAIMFDVLPSTGETFGALFGEVGLALTTFVIFPMIGATAGFYLSDISSRLSGEKEA
jgi:glycerol uptake facilitator-like aquaporin